MKVYGLYCNGELVMAKPMYEEPKTPLDFGIGEIPTSNYDIREVDVYPDNDGYSLHIPATIEV